jgi:hypothetical protein
MISNLANATVSMAIEDLTRSEFIIFHYLEINTGDGKAALPIISYGGIHASGSNLATLSRKYPNIYLITHN